jgi:hypothetical protein
MCSAITGYLWHHSGQISGKSKENGEGKMRGRKHEGTRVRRQ